MVAEKEQDLKEEPKLEWDKVRDKLQVIVPGLYPSWRESQEEVIQQVFESNKKYIALQAPTGFGKSATAVGNCMIGGSRGLVLTQTKQLGEQYYGDYYTVGLRTVKGRNNFECEIIPTRTADTAPCVAGMKCSYKSGGCAYYDQKREASQSEVASMNIHYFLYEANYGGDFSGVDILYIDEAHKLESVLQDFIEIRLSRERFADEGKPIPEKLEYDILTEWAEGAQGTIEAEHNQILEELLQDPTNEILAIRGIRLAAALNNLKKFSMFDETWIIEEDQYAVILKPVWIAKYIDDVLGRHAQKIVMMSATLPRSIMEGMGIIDYEYISLAPTFDVKNRPVIWIPAANLARSAADPVLELKKLVRAVDAIADKFPGEKGIIHTVNYRIGQAILDQSKHVDRIITHKDSGDRELILEQFRRSTTNSILMSPSFTEGVDLPYDQCRWQIITKIPYTDLSNKQVKARMSNDQQWYATNAIVTMIQAYGRIMRAEDDSGVTYILDSSLMNLINRWRTIFDQLTGFLDALFIVDGSTLVPFNEFSLKGK